MNFTTRLSFQINEINMLGYINGTRSKSSIICLIYQTAGITRNK